MLEKGLLVYTHIGSHYDALAYQPCGLNYNYYYLHGNANLASNVLCITTALMILTADHGHTMYVIPFAIQKVMIEQLKYQSVIID